ncbi:MAG: pyridoxamine 5'-phosphate oxidase family protein [Gammaproteobacteria bacterium]|nr:pyridoxamine 5'-phosphate oxidase family protein [Gammaproteobacteria bacterium]MDD9960070.1 pyridoxamine 5'-phosphate oxidase family protein [Gammaproteobacteria bacterium]
MAKRYEQLSDDHIEFIQQQKIYFVGTAANDGTINVSPKGFDSLRVLSPKRIVWMNITGSGNETAAHLQQSDRLTMMFCAFDGSPKILRLYGKAAALHPRDEQWQELEKLFEPHPSARQLVDFSIGMAQTSCGFGVPFYEFKEERDNMGKWLQSAKAQDIAEYWRTRNQVSLDGLPTNILVKETSED